MEHLNELRVDAVTGRRVIARCAPALAPSEYRVDKHEKKSQTCPFCPGKEAMTPGEVLAVGRGHGAAPDSPGWKLRVVPNRYAAVSPDEKPGTARAGLYERGSAFGMHEVIVDHAEHGIEMADFSEEDMMRALRAYRERFRAAGEQGSLAYAMIFKNYGAQAGASLEHTHTQFVALPFVPSRAADEFEGAARYAAAKGTCAWCDDLRTARERGLEVRTNKHFAVYCPHASRFPFETHLAPLEHHSDFRTLPDGHIEALASALQSTLLGLKRLLEDPPFNFIIHSAPLGPEKHPHFHWHIEIIPKLTRTAAFEWGTGFYVNPTPAEASAGFLRNA